MNFSLALVMTVIAAPCLAAAEAAAGQIHAHAAILYAPAVIDLLDEPDSSERTQTDIPCPIRTSTCRNFGAILFGVGRLFPILDPSLW